MALTYTAVDEDVQGKYRVITKKVTLDDSYPAGGEAITAAAVGLSKIVKARIVGANAAAGRLLWYWDPTNGKLMAFYPTGGDAVSPAALADPAVATTPDAGATNLTGSAAKPTLAGVVTPGRGKEVKAATDLSTCEVTMEFVGC